MQFHITRIIIMVQLSERPITNKITNLQQKFIYEINTIFDAENRFLEAQQMMWQCCQNNKLKTVIEPHLQETEQHIKNLEQVLNILGEKCLMISFRGTETVKNLMKDLDIRRHPMGNILGKELFSDVLEDAEKLGNQRVHPFSAHRGFITGIQNVYPKIIDKIPNGHRNKAKIPTINEVVASDSVSVDTCAF